MDNTKVSPYSSKFISGMTSVGGFHYSLDDTGSSCSNRTQNKDMDSMLSLIWGKTRKRMPTWQQTTFITK